jgi:hypothetical protein
VELAKILLHLDNSYAMDEFSTQRHKAMVAVTVLCPQLVAPYFTQEFYAPNYTLRHRLDVLEVSLLCCVFTCDDHYPSDFGFFSIGDLYPVDSGVG